MTLLDLRLQNVRCLAAAELTLHPRLNLITGDNAAGKTSLLEALSLLGRGRSFRTRYTEQLIRRSEDELWVAGRVALPEDGEAVPVTVSAPVERSHRLDLRCDRSAGVTARIDGQEVRSLERLSEQFPLQVIDPGIHRLIEEGPMRRRRWLDWTVFHVEPTFLSLWQGYGRALRQRDAALEKGTDPRPWEIEMARLGEPLTALRARVLEGLHPHWVQLQRTLDAVPATLGFHAGWNREQGLLDSLARQRDKDRERGGTRVGPHRFDVSLRIEGRPVREVVSRGQQKLLGAAMALSAVRYVGTATGQTATLLLDDPAAELDEAHTRALLAATAELGGQRVVTALDAAAEGAALGTPDAVFHVERGMVKRL